MKLDAVGGRKVALTLIMAAIGIGLVFYMGDIPAGLLALMQTIFGAFVVGNAFEHMSNAAVKRKQPVEIPQVDNSVDFEYLSSKIDELNKQVEQQKMGVAQANQSLATVQQALSFIIDKAGLGNDR